MTKCAGHPCVQQVSVAGRLRATARETQLRNGLLATATQAALAEREVTLARLQADSTRLGTLTLANAGHTGSGPACLHNRPLTPETIGRVTSTGQDGVLLICWRRLIH